MARRGSTRPSPTGPVAPLSRQRDRRAQVGEASEIYSWGSPLSGSAATRRVVIAIITAVGAPDAVLVP